MYVKKGKSLTTHLMKYMLRRIRYIRKIKHIAPSKFDGSLHEIKGEYLNLNEIYCFFEQYYFYKIDKVYRIHRKYFRKNKRGFGEDAFHALWVKIFEEFRPKNCLEIGVYRGQTLSLWALISKRTDLNANIFGITPLNNLGDDVSRYEGNLNYLLDIEKNFKKFGLEFPHIIKGESSANHCVEFMHQTKWDLIYIDGGHDYATVFQDYRNSLESLKIGGILVLDDSSLFRNYKADEFSFKGHHGPSMVATDLADKEMILLITVGHNNVYQKIA